MTGRLDVSVYFLVSSNQKIFQHPDHIYVFKITLTTFVQLSSDVSHLKNRFSNWLWNKFTNNYMTTLEFTVMNKKTETVHYCIWFFFLLLLIWLQRHLTLQIKKYIDWNKFKFKHQFFLNRGHQTIWFEESKCNFKID